MTFWNCTPIAAACLLAGTTAQALAGWAVAVDNGTGISARGIVPVPGDGITPFWGGLTRSGDVTVETALDANGVTHPVAGGQDALGTALFGGLTSVHAYQDGGGYQASGYISPDGVHVHAAIFGSFDGSWMWEDIHPPGYTNSYAAISDGQLEQLGWAQDSAGTYHAYTFEDPPGRELPMPAGFTGASATGVTCEIQDVVNGFIGYGWTNGLVQPLFWRQDDMAAVSVLPKGASQAVAVAADYADTACEFAGSEMQAGSAQNWHAVLWRPLRAGGFATTHLHPGKPYVASSIYTLRQIVHRGKSEVLEAGLATLRVHGQTEWHAMVWSGDAGSKVDLNLLLPPGFAQSVATGIDETGDIEGAALDSGGVWHDVTWAIK